MPTPLVICSTHSGGCGFIGVGRHEFWGGPEDPDYIGCPTCGEDHAFGLDAETINMFTDKRNLPLARLLLERPHEVAGKATCGCVHHAAENIPCVHDVQLARETFYASQPPPEPLLESQF